MRQEKYIVRYTVRSDERVRNYEDAFDGYEQALAFAEQLIQQMGGSIDTQGKSAAWVRDNLGLEGWVLKLREIKREAFTKETVWCPVRGDVRGKG